MNRAASQLKGKAAVYDIIVPTSMDITLPASVRKDVQSSDQRKAMDYMYDSMSDDVAKVDIYDHLRNHRDEYIYFRTDHHWTALGAYYAYEKFCQVKGVAPASLEDDFQTVEYPGFLGSFYSDSGKSPALAGGDTIDVYKRQPMICPAASSSGQLWPRCCCAGRMCCCWMSPPRAWTRTSSGYLPRFCTSCWAGAWRC